MAKDVIEVKEADFKAMVKRVAIFAPTKSTLPIIASVLIEPRAGQLYMSATNLEVGFQTWASIKEDGKVNPVAIPNSERFFVDMANSLSGEMLKLSNDTKAQKFNIVSGSYKSSLKYLDPNDFPPMPAIEKNKGIMILESQLKKALMQVVKSAAVEETRPELNAVLFDFKGKGVVFVATDGFRMSLKALQLSQEAPIQKMLMPLGAVKKLIQVLDQERNRPVYIQQKEGKQITVTTEDWMFSAVPCSKEYIEYTQWAKRADMPFKMSFETDALRRELRRCLIISSHDSMQVDLKPAKQKDKVSFHVEANQVARHVGEASYTGSSREVKFNNKLLLDCLDAIDSKEVEIALEKPEVRTFAFIYPVGDKSFFTMLVPIVPENKEEVNAVAQAAAKAEEKA